ncbi:cytidylyltransferase domain-containing protein [Flavobacterium soyae]|uniref:CMP-N-acetylneuraminic acid synthetase n=1 Tax=Flavobacterium soyae TaxID=2903098 RepID=A0ABZ2UJW1_9FLAO
MSYFYLTALLPIQKEYPSHVLPNRNFLPFNGKPMYQYMIEKLLKFTQFESIVINTDSDEVKEYCKWNGRLRIIDRPESLIGEDIKSDLITAHTLEKISGEHFIEFQSFNPLVTNYTIDSFIKQYMDHIVPGEYFDSVFSIQRYELRNYDLEKREMNDEFQFSIIENGILHGFTRTSFRKHGKKIGKTVSAFEVKEIENTLLDSDTNYELVKLVFANQDKFPAIFHSGV